MEPAARATNPAEATPRSTDPTERPLSPSADIDWQLRFGESETPEIKKFLGYE